MKSLLRGGSTLLLPLVYLLGCGGNVDGTADHESSAAQDLIGGIPTSARTEIFNWGCSATVIDPRFAITASHCVTATGPMNVAITLNGQDVVIDRAYKMNRGAVGADDIALLRFDRAVTSVTPAGLSDVWPANGSLATIFGFGCTGRPNDGQAGPKRYFSFFVGNTTRQLCPGDSGGPVVFGGEIGTGRVFAVNSGYSSDNGADIFAQASYGALGLRAVKVMADTTELNRGVPDFPGWAQAQHAKAAAGDFNNDGCGDILLAGGNGWTTTPLAAGDCGGGFTVHNLPAGGGNGDLPALALHARFVLPGRFLSSHVGTHTGVALVGGPWFSLPVAFHSQSWHPKNVLWGQQARDFNTWAASSGVAAHAGDFNADGLTDIALTGGLGWQSIPVALSRGDGTFTFLNKTVSSFPTWAGGIGHKTAVGDFDADGDADIAVTGGNGFGSIPVAFSNRDGTFTVTNKSVGHFPVWMQRTGARMVAADFDRDGAADLAATGPFDWVTVPLAFSNWDGSFRPGSLPLPNFPGWGSVSRFFFAQDMNDDSRPDLVLTGGAGWATQPMALNLNCFGWC